MPPTSERHVPLGDILDSLGVIAQLDEGDLVTSAVVLLSVLVPDSNNPRLTISTSEGMSWIEQAGLVCLAERIVTDPPEVEE